MTLNFNMSCYPRVAFLDATSLLDYDARMVQQSPAVVDPRETSRDRASIRVRRAVFLVLRSCPAAFFQP
jgi:hypothetical protein